MKKTNGVQIVASFGGKPTLDALSKVLEARMKWLGNTANQSVAAVAIDSIKSLRSITRVANPKRQKPAVTPDKSLIASIHTEGKLKIPCVRTAGGKQLVKGRVISSNDRGKMSDKHVFRWKYWVKEEEKEAFILATSLKDAKMIAKQRLANRVKRYSGLAKHAFTKLMMKVSDSTKAKGEAVGIDVDLRADKYTAVQERYSDNNKIKGYYTLIATDMLDYAKLALKGGGAQVDIALKKAMNKQVSVINQFLKSHYFLDQKLPTPFPELVRRRKR